ncbi:VOC family protein [Salinicola acroporae]|uniref:VOC family protein n=1 Tax=Salinicola acroporae TaxID=1541440 RepID=UPI0013A62E9E|nr:VOC family protein [Salinicola acroporae]
MPKPPRPAAPRVNHVGFSVRCLESSIRLWCECFGATLVRQGEMSGSFLSHVTGAPDTNVKMAIVEIDGFPVELLEYALEAEAPRSGGYRQGVAHLAFDVDDIEVTLGSVSLHGWQAQGEVQTLPAVEKKGTKVMYIVGPDGCVVELMQPPERSLE